MEPKRKIQFWPTSVDDWIEEKRKSDGAEGLWRIHNKLYDFTVWSRKHPGGQFWLDSTRGTDITEAFESHHFSNKAELELSNYYRREAQKPRNYTTTFHQNGLYKQLKSKLSNLNLETVTKPSYTLSLISDILAAAVFLTGILGVRFGIAWTVASGILLGLLSVLSHTFLHLKDNWRVYYFDLSLMSSRHWRIIHVLSHHQFRNTNSDLEIPFWQPDSRIQRKLPGFLQILIKWLSYSTTAHVQFLRRWLDVFLSKKMEFNPEEFISFSFPVVLYLFGAQPMWEAFSKWNLTIAIGSFIFCLCNFFSQQSRINGNKNTQSDKDFATTQLLLTTDNLKEETSGFSFLNSFRKSALHYLFPTICCENLNKIIPVLDDKEFGTDQEGFLDKLQNAKPQGHVFFS